MASNNHGKKVSASRQLNSIRRLLSDLTEWQHHSHEYPCVDAQPLEDNLFEWHCNLAPNGGRFEGVIIHLILYFPCDYPLSPPDVKICSRIHHPNVYGEWLCLDMIRKYEQGRYKGWTAAYSVSSLLMQLQSFLFEEGGVDQDYGGSYSNNWSHERKKSLVRSVRKFTCSRCSHSYDAPFPPVRKDFEPIVLDAEGRDEMASMKLLTESAAKNLKQSMRDESGRVFEKVSNTTKTYFDLKVSEARAGVASKSSGSQNKQYFDRFAPGSARNLNARGRGKKKKKTVLSMSQFNQRLARQARERANLLEQQGILCADPKSGANPKNSKNAQNARQHQRNQENPKKRQKNRKNQKKKKISDVADGRVSTTQAEKPGEPGEQGEVLQQVTFKFWDGIYYDLESAIFAFFDIRDVLKMMRVSRRFRSMCEMSNLYLRHGIQCWFHRALRLPRDVERARKLSVARMRHDVAGVGQNDMLQLVLGFGVTPHFYRNIYDSRGSGDVPTLGNQIFASKSAKTGYVEGIQNSIGKLPMLSHVDTTFDLLSSDAFETFGVRKNVFKDAEFTHFVPLYISRTHGKLATKMLERFIKKIFEPCLQIASISSVNAANSGRSQQRGARADAWLDFSNVHAGARAGVISSFHGVGAVGAVGAMEPWEQSQPQRTISFDEWKKQQNQDYAKRTERVREAAIMEAAVKASDEAENLEKKENLQKSGNGKGYHPYLAIYAVASIMKSIIVSVMQRSQNCGGQISLHYSINVLEGFFRYHHLLLAIYYLNKKKLKPIVQDQVNLFFKNILNAKEDEKKVAEAAKDEMDAIDGKEDELEKGQKGKKYETDMTDDTDYRSKRYIPDFGVFLMYLTLWECDLEKKGIEWNDIATELWDENMTRQVKWVLNEEPEMIQNQNKTLQDRQARLRLTWNNSEVSRRLFMFQYFFLKQVCQLFGAKSVMTPTLKYKEYNENFGTCGDKTLAVKLQRFVKQIYLCKNYKEHFEMVEMEHPGNRNLAEWMRNCMYKSEMKGYHKPYVYYSRLRKNQPSEARPWNNRNNERRNRNERGSWRNNNANQRNQRI